MRVSKFFKTLHVRLIIAICIPLMLLQTGMIALEYKLRLDEEISDLQNYLMESARQQAADLDSRFKITAQVARLTASLLMQVDPHDDVALNNLLTNSLTQNSLIYSASIAYLPSVREAGIYGEKINGQVSLRPLPRAEIDHTSRPWFADAVAKNISLWNGPYTDNLSNNIILVSYSVPFTTVGGVQGVVVIDVLFDHVNPNPEWQGLWGGFARLINEQGNYLTLLPLAERTPDNERNNDNLFLAAERLDVSELAEVGREMVAGKSGVVRIRDPLDGEGMFWLAYAPVSSTGWSFAALVDEDEVVGGIYEHLKRHLFIAFLSLALVLLTIILVTRHLTRPLAQLNRVAQEVGKGNLELRVGEIGAKDEVGSFAIVFDRMLDDLKIAMADRMHEVEARQAMQKEMALARDIQRNLLPSSQPKFDPAVDCALYALCKPATIMSGDFYDYFMLDNDTLVLAIADVCGKGMPAALYMALTRTTLRNFSTIGQSPAHTVRAANAALAQENPDAMFVSLFFAHYELSTGRLRYVCAGHPPPLLRLRDGSLKELTVTGALLGVFPNENYSEETIILQPGEQLVLYTDGVTEAGVRIEDPYGEERLATLIDALVDQPIDQVSESIADAVLEHAGGEQEDDITLMILRRQEAVAMEIAV